MFQAVCDASVDNGSASAPTLDIHCDTSESQPQSRGEERRADGTETTALHYCSLHTSTHPSNPANIRQQATVDQYFSLPIVPLN